MTTWTRRPGLLIGLSFCFAAALVAPVSVPTASAAAQLMLVAKTVAPPSTSENPLRPGDEITYAINYNCSSVEAATCEGAVLTDILPEIETIGGGSEQLEFVGVNASAPAHWTFNGVSNVDGLDRATWTGTAALTPGTSGALFLVLRIPAGIIPVLPEAQSSTNTAIATLAGQTPSEATSPVSFVNAEPPDSTITKTGPSTALLNLAGTAPVSHTIRICPQAGTMLWPNYTVVDTLPVGATVVTDPLPFGGQFAPDLDDPATTGGTITWELDAENRPTPDSSGCLVIPFQVAYVNAVSGGHESNEVGETKTNTVVATGFETDPGDGQAIGPATTTLTLIGPVTRFGGSKSADNFYVTDGDEVVFTIGASNTSDHEAVAFSTATLTDGPLPSAFTLTEVRTGTWDGATDEVTATIDVSTNGTDWTEIATEPNMTITLGLEDVTHVRWVFDSVDEPAIDTGWSTTGLQLVGTMTGTPDPSETLQNCVTLSGVQGGIQQDRPGACRSLELETPQPHPSISKTVSSAILEPGDTVTYTLTVGNDADATGDLIDPRVVDCVPSAQFLEVSNIVPGNDWSGGVVGPDAGCHADSTRLEFTYDGTLEPGQQTPVITYDVTAADFDSPGDPTPPTPPGLYTNTAALTQADGTDFNHCVQSGCTRSRNVTVPPVIELDSLKLVRGSLDSGFNIAGTTSPGGQLTYRVEVQNIGNTEIEDIELIDIFPHVGDTGVQRTNQERNSEYRPVLVSPIDAPPAWTVEYSTSANPCRPGVLPLSATGCEPPNWTDTPDPLLLPSYRSIRLLYSPRLDIGESVEFEWQMIAPITDSSYADGADPYGRLSDCTIPVSDPPYPDNVGASTLTDRDSAADPSCPRASNSFAYGALIPDDQLGGLPNPGRLGAEPEAVALYVASDAPGSSLGDLVWNDIDKDGIQGPDEPGIPLVRVELYEVDDDELTLVDVTFTDDDGRYLFDGLDDGDYRVRFHLPDGQGYATLQSVGADTTIDSDVPRDPSGTTALGNYYDTATITLGVDEQDLTWDAGVWIADPDISIVKTVNGDDANTAPGIQLFPGGEIVPGGATLDADQVTWTYEVANTGNTYLTGVTVTDEVIVSDEDAPTPVCDWSGSSDPTTPAGILSPGETVTCTATGDAINGHYANLAEVEGTATRHPTDPTDSTTYDPLGLVDIEPQVVDDDPAHYTGVAFQLGDLVFLDVDDDGTFTPGVDVPVPVAVEVQLFEGDPAAHDPSTMTPLAVTTTTLGRYVFSNLPAGSYYVVIPATQFDEGGPLDGFDTANDAETDPTVQLNEGDDHHAVHLNGVDTSDGVISAVGVTFEATLQGNEWIGNAPTDDAPLGTPIPDIYGDVADHLANLTLDMGVRGVPPIVVTSESVCVNDVPFLRFRVDLNFEPVDPIADVEFRGADGDGLPIGPALDAFEATGLGTANPSLAGAPLQTVPIGEWITVLWPEASVDAEFEPTGWPGWEFTGGRWVEVPTDVTPQLAISVEVNPDIDVALEYPPPTDECVASPPLTSIGDRVWWDQDADGDDQSGTEPGIPDATVTIVWAGPDGEFGTADDVTYPGIVTDADGYYLLDNLPAGEYRVTVSDVDPGFTPTFDVDGIDTPLTATISLAENEDRRDVDFGFRVPMALGDLVWFDVDGDGSFTPDLDVPLAGVPLELWTPTSADPIATTVTDSEGRYLFDDLDPGGYSVRIPASAFTSGLLTAWNAAPGGVADPNDDVDEGDLQTPGDHNAFDQSGGVRTGTLLLTVDLDPDGSLVSGEPGTGEPGGEFTNLTLDLALSAPVSIDIEKATNGVDADTGPGPFIPAGSTVTWTYVVNNTGAVPLTDVTVSDSVEGPVCTIALLRPGTSNAVTCSLTGTSRTAPAAAQYANLAVTEGQPALPYGDASFEPPIIDVTSPVDDVWPTDPAVYQPIVDTDQEPLPRVSDDDPSHYFSARPDIDIEKATNGVDADTGPGPFVLTGSTVTWTYVITNTGNVGLGTVTVTDDRNVTVVCPGGTNIIPALAPGASTTCTGTGTAGAGPYVNLGSVIGTPIDDNGQPIIDPGTSAPMVKPTDSDPSHHVGANPDISIDKQVCNRATPSNCNPAASSHWVEHAIVDPDQPARWRIVVTNTGNVRLDDVTVSDDIAPNCARNLGMLSPGQVRTFTCDLAAVDGSVTNVADVTGVPVAGDGTRITPAGSSTPLPPVTDVDDASASLPPALTAAKVVDTESAQLGESVTWTITITNTGMGPARDVEVVDILPEGLTVNSPDNGTSYDPVAHRLTVSIPLLEPGASSVFSYTTTVDAVTEGPMVNLVAVSSLGPTGTVIAEAEAAASVEPVAPDSLRLPGTGATVSTVVLAAMASMLIGMAIWLPSRRRSVRAHTAR